jgi:hypothetical protein
LCAVRATLDYILVEGGVRFAWVADRDCRQPNDYLIELGNRKSASDFPRTAQVPEQVLMSWR